MGSCLPLSLLLTSADMHHQNTRRNGFKKCFDVPARRGDCPQWSLDYTTDSPHGFVTRLTYGRFSYLMHHRGLGSGFTGVMPIIVTPGTWSVSAPATIFIYTACIRRAPGCHRIYVQVRNWQYLAVVFIDMALLSKVD